MDAIRKTAIVTGGTRGIGRSIALALGTAGYDLVLTYRSQDDAAARTAAECRHLGVAVETLKADGAVASNVERVITTALARFGSIDVLVNNAGTNIDKPLVDLTEDDWDTVVDTNLKAVFLFCRSVAGWMSAQRHRGVIINIGASTAIQGRKNGVNYCAAKAGVLVLTKCLALELAPLVRVNCIIPGSTAECGSRRTPEAELVASIPMARLAMPSDVAAAVTFMVSDQAGYITGQKLLVNGGQFMF